jgi:DNA-binding LytR/AlgR family response regulator
MKTKCLLVDDEPLAIEVIENHLSKFEHFQITAKCSSAIQALEVLQKKKIDLMFLDIQMPEITGLEFLNTLTSPPKVILTTAHRKYAIEGYEHDVIDYLLKPISFERFVKAINKFYKVSDSDMKVVSNEPAEDNFIYVKENKKVVKIFLDEILYIESMKDYVTIFTKSKRVVSKATITSLEEKLPDEQFIRIHRSYIVSKTHISAFTASSVEIYKKELTVGRSYKNAVMKELGINIK